MPDRAIFIVLGVFFDALLRGALAKVLWDRRPKLTRKRRRRSPISR